MYRTNNVFGDYMFKSEIKLLTTALILLSLLIVFKTATTTKSIKESPESKTNQVIVLGVNSY